MHKELALRRPIEVERQLALACWPACHRCGRSVDEVRMSTSDNYRQTVTYQISCHGQSELREVASSYFADNPGLVDLGEAFVGWTSVILALEDPSLYECPVCEGRPEVGLADQQTADDGTWEGTFTVECHGLTEVVELKSSPNDFYMQLMPRMRKLVAEVLRHSTSSTPEEELARLQALGQNEPELLDVVEQEVYNLTSDDPMSDPAYREAYDMGLVDLPEAPVEVAMPVTNLRLSWNAHRGIRAKWNRPTGVIGLELIAFSVKFLSPYGPVFMNPSTGKGTHDEHVGAVVASLDFTCHISYDDLDPVFHQGIICRVQPIYRRRSGTQTTAGAVDSAVFVIEPPPLIEASRVETPDVRAAIAAASRAETPPQQFAPPEPAPSVGGRKIMFADEEDTDGE